MEPISAILTVVSVIETLMKVAPVVVSGIADLKEFAVALYEKFTGNNITPEQRKELEDKIEALHIEFQAPIPSEDQQ